MHHYSSLHDNAKLIIISIVGSSNDQPEDQKNIILAI